MGIFGDDKTAEIEALQARIAKSDARSKALAAELAQERAKTAALQAEIEAGKAQLEQVKAAMVRTRQRQKASVERANRFKAKLSTGLSTGVNGAVNVDSFECQQPVK